jgi:hypothetical protein
LDVRTRTRSALRIVSQRRIIGRHDHLSDRPQRYSGELEMRPGEGERE